MIYGENYVEIYSPVQAFSVDARDSGIVSGGGGGSTVVTEGNTFLWVWNPEVENRGGFTGQSWLVQTEGTPINVMGWDLADLEQHFQTSDNLDNVFATWQNFVNNDPDGNWVNKFIIAISNADCVVPVQS